MPILLHPGSTGADVARLEIRLRELGLYGGAADNVYGGRVESAVKAFQKSQSLTPDGVVGDQTWARLFPDTISAPAVSPLLREPLVRRCLALTGTFETGTGIPECYAGLSGDFDGQGISFGVLQWNIGQGTLQPMLLEMLSEHEDAMNGLFHDRLGDIRTMLKAPLSSQLDWARSIQDPVRHNISEPWKGLIKALGKAPEFQAIQVEHAAATHRAALGLCARFGVTTERAIALMFDIRVQNYSISAATEAQIRADFAAIPADAAPPDTELARLRSIANRRAEAASRQFVEDVRIRKLAIANGFGTVHGVVYDLERQFGIRLLPVDCVADGVVDRVKE
jgi:putative peptidoglycan binding protein